MKDNDNYINQLILKDNEDEGMLGVGGGSVGVDLTSTPRSEGEVPPPQIVVEESPQKVEAKGEPEAQSPLKQET